LPAVLVGIGFLITSFSACKTLATVGYGHMYPQTLYGHIVSTVEIMTGIFLLAAMTGLIFVRFSRPIARVVFSNSIVIAPLNGKPTLMVRIGNENQHSMVEAEFRIHVLARRTVDRGWKFPLTSMFSNSISTG